MHITSLYHVHQCHQCTYTMDSNVHHTMTCTPKVAAGMHLARRGVGGAWLPCQPFTKFQTFKCRCKKKSDKWIIIKKTQPPLTFVKWPSCLQSTQTAVCICSFVFGKKLTFFEHLRIFTFMNSSLKLFHFEKIWENPFLYSDWPKRHWRQKLKAALEAKLHQNCFMNSPTFIEMSKLSKTTTKHYFTFQAKMNQKNSNSVNWNAITQ